MLSEDEIRDYLTELYKKLDTLGSPLRADISAPDPFIIWYFQGKRDALQAVIRQGAGMLDILPDYSK